MMPEAYTSKQYQVDQLIKMTDDAFLKVPDHMLEADEMVLIKVPGDVDSEGKHGSLTVIFSVWNAMVGTGLLTLPWAFSQGGLVLGLSLTFAAFVLSFSTQYLIMVAAKNDTDFTETIRRYYGPRG